MAKKSPGKIMTILQYTFGKNPKTVFTRIMIMLVTIGIIYVLSQCVGCEYTKRTGWKFYWKPAATINVDIKKGGG